MPISLHSVLMLMPAILATGGFISTMVFSFWCETVRFHVRDGINMGPGLGLGGLVKPVSFGPWYRMEIEYGEWTNWDGETELVSYKTCTDYYLDPDIDSKWKLVRAVTIITSVIGGLAAIAMFFVPCLQGRIPGPVWYGMVFVFICILTLFQGLGFLFLSSNACDASTLRGTFFEKLVVSTLYEQECEWDAGMTANIVATVFWFCAGALMVVMGNPPAPPREPAETQDVEYQQNEDGEAEEVKVVKGEVIAEQPVEDVGNVLETVEATPEPAAAEGQESSGCAIM